MQKKNELDFIVIGAAKSGTTTLFELLNDHPEVYMPPEKEIPFFSDEKAYSKGLGWYLDSFFPHRETKKIKGTVTPQYMSGEGKISPQKVAARIRNTMPNVRIIAILRNPVDRTFSHYNMLKQRGKVAKDLEKILLSVQDDYLDNDKLGSVSAENFFIHSSEYGKILGYYYDLFPREQILVLFTEELKSNPSETLKKLYSFLNIDDSYESKNIGKEYRKGGSRPKIKYLTPGFLFKLPFIETIWKNYIPYKFRRRVEYFINLWNTKANNKPEKLNSKLARQLASYYSSDIKKLQFLAEKPVPWDDYK